MPFVPWIRRKVSFTAFLAMSTLIPFGYARIGLKKPDCPSPKPDQFFNAAEKLTDKSKNRYGYSIRGGSGSAINLEYMMYAYSGITNYFTEDGKCTLNDKLHVEFVENIWAVMVTIRRMMIFPKASQSCRLLSIRIAAMIAHNSGSATSHDIAFEGDRTKFQMLKFPSGLNGLTYIPPRTEAAFTISSDSKVKTRLGSTWSSSCRLNRFELLQDS